MELTAGHIWVMVASAFVLLMTPGVAFFYGGMTRAKSTLNMMMMSFVAMGIVGVVWVLWGYSMSTGDGVAQLFGSPGNSLAMSNIIGTDKLITAGYGATFAIITVALISGAIADRAKFSAWCVFVPIWVTVVYCPLVYMVWGGGLLSANGAIGKAVGTAIDFAGGTVVHINAGMAGLVLALVIGKRRGFGSDPNHRPHNVPYAMLGAALLWFGWFGFNGGAASSAEQAGLIWINTMVAPAAAMLAWVIVERIRDGRPTSLGAVSGVVAGLVAITPACANVSPLGAIAIGILSGTGSCIAIGWKFKLGYDDSLDVVGVHLVSGVIGTLTIGFFALQENGAGGGLFYGGGLAQLWTQFVACVFSIVFSGVLTFIIGFAIHKTIGFRVSIEDEERGVDLSEHAETAYVFTGVNTGGRFDSHHSLTHKPQQIKDSASV